MYFRRLVSQSVTRQLIFSISLSCFDSRCHFIMGFVSCLAEQFWETSSYFTSEDELNGVIILSYKLSSYHIPITS